jgi:predicted metal-dependent RNase
VHSIVIKSANVAVSALGVAIAVGQHMALVTTRSASTIIQCAINEAAAASPISGADVFETLGTQEGTAD